MKNRNQKRYLFVVCCLFTFLISGCDAANNFLGLNLDFLPENRVLEQPTITQNDTSIQVNGTTTFTASGSGENAVYNWSVAEGEGTIGATGDSVTFTASSNPGEVTISVYASRTGSPDSDPAQAQLSVAALDVLPTPSISGNSLVFPMETTELTASGSGSDVTYTWSVSGSGSIEATGETVTYTASATEETAVISCIASKAGFSDSATANYSVRVATNHYAFLSSTVTTAGTNFNPSTPTSVSWTAISIDSSYFTLTGTSSEQLSVQEDGDYFLVFTIPVTATLQRSAVKAEVYVNGSVIQGTTAESSYIRNNGGHNESSDHMAVLLDGLSANDYIEVKVVQGGNNGTVTVDSAATLYIEYVEPEEVIFSGTATETTGGTDLNSDTAAPLKWTHTVSDSGYTHSNVSNPENIVLDNPGYYLVFVNLPLSSTDNDLRYNVKTIIQLDGSTVLGGEAKQGYIRTQDGHQESSVHWSGIVHTSASGQTLQIKTQREASSNLPVTVGAARKASIYIEKVHDEAYVFSSSGISLSGGSNWNPASAQDILWTNDIVIDSDVFSHSTGAGSENITMTQSGDYLLVYNDALQEQDTAEAERMSPKIQVEINGSPVTGAETKTHYLRNYTVEGNYESSGSLVYYLNNISSGQNVSITAEANAAAGSVGETHPAIITLIRKK